MIWGSRTLLEPVESSRDRENRSVGIPVDLRRFAADPDYRSSILMLQLEIWNHEVSEHFLFFKEQANEVLHLCRRNHHPHIETIVWLLPEASHRQTLGQLHDLGFRTICLSDKVMPGILESYKISSRCTIRTVVRKKILEM